MTKTRLRPSARAALTTGLLAVLLLAGCDDSSSNPVVDTPDIGEIPTVTITVEGTFGQGSRSLHEFTAIGNGFARMTLTALAPVSTLTIGIGIGTPSEVGGCTLIASDTSVRLNDSLLSQGVVAGTVYCVSVFDVGNLFEGNEVIYTMTIEHS